jgi:WYL_2, Sm-like SH3 beta-barrel fold
MNINDYNDLYNFLKNNVAHVKFTKVDGTERVMRCTLKDDMLPEQYRGKGSMLTEAGNALRVFDLDVGQWRSFKPESVLQLSAAATSSRVSLNG